MKAKEIKKAVKSGYAKVALQNAPCCGANISCCGGANLAEEISRKIGYSDEELKTVPEGANLGLGCGNPIAFASLKEGEIVLDLGSGAGFDCFIAASKVGNTGKIIGVDMTPEMVEKARANAKDGDFPNVEFRLGEIENLPVSDNHVDAVISNCVINLSVDKKKVFREAFRVLKPGGRLMVSDMVLVKALPHSIRESIEAYISCVAGALMKEEYLADIEAAGFREIQIVGEDTYPLDLMAADPLALPSCADATLSKEQAKDLSSAVASIKIFARKPS